MESIAIPGLLQTQAYADVAEHNNYRPVTEEYINERVELRLLRQKVLDREPVPSDYQVLINDNVLTTVVGDPAVMAEQLDHLDTMFHQANVDIRVLPLGAGDQLDPCAAVRDLVPAVRG